MNLREFFKEYNLIIIVLILFCIICLGIYRSYFIEREDKKKIDKKRIDKMAQILIRSCARWATASLQDESPLIAVLHANYAAGYLWAIRDIFTDEEIKLSTGINRVEFEKKIIDVQDKATKYMVQVCPEYGSNLNIELAKTGGEYI
jgi:hypothetical protein